MSQKIEQTVKVAEVFNESLTDKVYQTGYDNCSEIECVYTSCSSGKIDIEVDLEDGNTYLISRNQIKGLFTEAVNKTAKHFKVTPRTVMSKFTVQFNDMDPNDFLDKLIDDCVNNFNYKTGFTNLKALCKNHKCDSNGWDTDNYIETLCNRI